MPEPGENIYSWSTTALDNGTADSAIAWPEGQTRASVNNSARGMMAALAKDRNLQNGTIVTTGTANAQAFASGALVPYTTVPTGMRVLLKIGAALTNTAAVTLNMDGIGAVAIKTKKGFDLSSGELYAGTYVEFVYNGTNWILLREPAELVLVAPPVIIITPVPAVEFTEGIDDSYEAYLFTLTDIVAGTDSVNLSMQVSEDEGVTWKAGATDYVYAINVGLDNATSGQFGATYSAVNWTNASVSSDPTKALSGTLRMFKPAGTTAYKKFQYDSIFFGSGGRFGRWVGGGAYKGTTNAINGVKFLMSSGDIASGEIRLYGLTGA